MNIQVRSAVGTLSWEEVSNNNQKSLLFHGSHSHMHSSIQDAGMN
jgi:hypothetical protein